MSEKNHFETAVEAGIAMSGATFVAERPFIALPQNFVVNDLEHYLPNPTRKRGQFTANDVQSFIRYVNAHKTGATVIAVIVGETSASFKAHLNHHGKEEANWNDHVLVYPCPQSPEWKRWTAKTLQQFTQQQFAEFIEDNLPDIVSPKGTKLPSGADMLEIAKTLQAKKSVAFRSAIRLENGDHQFQYDETTTAQAGSARKTLDVPSEFALALKPFVNSATYEVRARLRYGINEGALSFRYELVRAHLVIQDACNDLIKQITKETGIEPLNGAF